MTRAIDQALGIVLRDVAVADVPPPRVDATPWQSWEPSESVMLFAPDGSGLARLGP